MNINTTTKSRLGFLLQKYDRSGILNNPVIENLELTELVGLLKELENVASDINDSPFRQYAMNFRFRIEATIDARKRSL